MNCILFDCKHYKKGKCKINPFFYCLYKKKKWFKKMIKVNFSLSDNKYVATKIKTKETIMRKDKHLITMKIGIAFMIIVSAATIILSILKCEGII